MAKITRKNQKIFGISSGPYQVGVAGSLANGTPAYSKDPEVIQSLAQYLEGWFAMVGGQFSPAIEDMNALCYLYAYQLAYLFQQGVPEWNSETEYHQHSLITFNGTLYISLINTNTGNSPTGLISDTNWAILQDHTTLASSTIGKNVGPDQKVTFYIIDGSITSEKIGLGQMMPRITTITNSTPNDSVAHIVTLDDEMIDASGLVDNQTLGLNFTQEFLAENSLSRRIFIKVRPRDYSSSYGLNRLLIRVAVTPGPSPIYTNYKDYWFVNYQPNYTTDTTILYEVTILNGQITVNEIRDGFVFSVVGSGTVDVSALNKDVLLNVSAASGIVIARSGQIIHLWKGTAGNVTFSLRLAGTTFTGSITCSGNSLTRAYFNGQTVVTVPNEIAGSISLS